MSSRGYESAAGRLGPLVDNLVGETRLFVQAIEGDVRLGTPAELIVASLGPELGCTASWTLVNAYRALHTARRAVERTPFAATDAPGSTPA